MNVHYEQGVPHKMDLSVWVSVCVCVFGCGCVKKNPVNKENLKYIP